MKRRRGNILVMAIFISLFLFFLSVALVAQNRQDVLLSVTQEHRLRADAAALAGLELALHVMRTDPEWEARLDGAQGELETGGSWTLEPPLRLTDYPNLLEIRSVGVSGIARLTRRRIVEEIAMASSDTAGPHLFARTDQGEMAMLGPDFRWTVLGPAPDPQSWLAASGGPLVSHVTTSNTRPPEIWDLTTQGMERVQLQVDPARALARLELTDETASWKDIPSPDQEAAGLSRTAQPIVDGTRYVGPSLDWYTLTGEALVADGNTVWSHANHYFYRGATATISGQGYTLETPGRQFRSTAVLACDLSTGRWTIVADLMHVSNLREDPDITPASGTLVPNPDSLGRVDGRLYALQRGDDGAVLLASGRAWSLDRRSPGLSHGLYAYAGKLRLHTTAGDLDGLARIHLSEGLDPWRDLSLERSQVNGSLWDAKTLAFQDRPLRPALRIRPSLLGDLARADSFLEGGDNDGANCVAVQGRDLYTFVRLQVRYLVEPGVSYLSPFTPEFLQQYSTRQVAVLGHYDGARWQVWPGGLHELSISAPSATSRAIQVGAVRLDPGSLAAASYPQAGTSRLNRYAPVVDLP